MTRASWCLVLFSVSTISAHSLSNRPFPSFLRLRGGCTDNEPKPVVVTSDYVFKYVFSHKSVVTGFLEAILIGDDKLFPSGTTIEDVRYESIEQAQEGLLTSGTTPGKQTILDIKLKSKKEIYIIEMQKKISTDPSVFLKRIQFYSTVAHSGQQIKGRKGVRRSYETEYGNCLPVIAIVIIGQDRNLFDAEIPCVSYHRILETKTQRNLLTDLAWVFVELSKAGADEPYLDNAVNEWLNLLMRTNFEDPPQYTDQHVQLAADLVKKIRDKSWEIYWKDYEQEVIELELIEGFEADAVKERRRADGERRRADGESRRADVESRRADEAEREIPRLRAALGQNGATISNPLDDTNSIAGDAAPVEEGPRADARQGASDHSTSSHSATDHDDDAASAGRPG